MLAELLNLQVMYANEKACELEDRLSEWLDAEVYVWFSLEAAKLDEEGDSAVVATISVDDQWLCSMRDVDAVSAIDDLSSWAWGTLVISSGACVWDWGDFAEA